MRAHQWLTLAVSFVLLLTLVPAAGAVSGVPEGDNRLPPAAPALNPGSLAYGTDTINTNFAYFDVDVPGTVVQISPYSPIVLAGDFIGWDQSKVYAVRGDNDHLITLDVATGAETDLGALPAPVGGGWYNGMTYDPASGNTYVSSIGTSVSHLYLLDLATPSTTLIGEINSPAISAIAADDYGNLWGVDVTYDTLVMIDKVTAAAYGIGLLGFDSMYQQGLDWDSATDTLYMAAYNGALDKAELRTVDTFGGNSTLVGLIGNGTAAFGWVAIAGLPQPPEMEVMPPSLAQELRRESSATQELSICNTGFAPLNWNATEAPARLEAAGPTPPRQAADIDPPDVLLAAADNASEIEVLLEAYGDLGAVDYDDSRLSTPLLSELQAYDVVVTWSSAYYDDPVAMGDVLADYVDWGGKVINLMLSLGTTDYNMEGRFMDEHYTAMNGLFTDYATHCMGTYNAGHPIMAGVTNVCDYYRIGSTWLTLGSSDVAQWADDLLFVAAKDNHTAVTINGYVGNGHLWTGQMPDVLHNAILWQAGITEDISWLSEDMAAGIIQAGECATMTVTFDSEDLAPGDYTGDLIIWSNDPGTPQLPVPVNLTVWPTVYLPIVNKFYQSGD